MSIVACSLATITSSCCSRTVLVVITELVGELIREGMGEILPDAAAAYAISWVMMALGMDFQWLVVDGAFVYVASSR